MATPLEMAVGLQDIARIAAQTKNPNVLGAAIQQLIDRLQVQNIPMSDSVKEMVGRAQNAHRIMTTPQIAGMAPEEAAVQYLDDMRAKDQATQERMAEMARRVQQQGSQSMDVADMTVPQLKEELKQHGVSIKGNKADLQKALTEARSSTGTAPETTAPEAPGAPAKTSGKGKTAQTGSSAPTDTSGTSPSTKSPAATELTDALINQLPPEQQIAARLRQLYPESSILPESITPPASLASDLLRTPPTSRLPFAENYLAGNLPVQEGRGFVPSSPFVVSPTGEVTSATELAMEAARADSERRLLGLKSDLDLTHNLRTGMNNIATAGETELAALRSPTQIPAAAFGVGGPPPPPPPPPSWWSPWWPAQWPNSLRSNPLLH